jgi:hypothetical protein
MRMRIFLNHSDFESPLATEVSPHVSQEDAEERKLATDIRIIFPSSAALVDFSPRICGDGRIERASNASTA